MRRRTNEVAGESDEIRLQIVRRPNIPFQLRLLHEIAHVEICELDNP
jgi:hypothetical protein